MRGCRRSQNRQRQMFLWDVSMPSDRKQWSQTITKALGGKHTQKVELGSIGTCCPDRLWSLHSWRIFIVQLGKALSKMLCLHRWPHCEFGVYTDDLQSSSPNYIFLWCHDSFLRLRSSYSRCSCESYPYLFFPRTYPNPQGTGCLGKQFLYHCSFLELHLAYVRTLSGNCASSEANFCNFVYVS